MDTCVAFGRQEDPLPSLDATKALLVEVSHRKDQQCW